MQLLAVCMRTCIALSCVHEERTRYCHGAIGCQSPDVSWLAGVPERTAHSIYIAVYTGKHSRQQLAPWQIMKLASIPHMACIPTS